jgi:hypothetical protein
MSCYSNAGLILPSDAALHENVTFESCGCLSIHQNISDFQYNNDTNSCYIFPNNSSLSNIRVTINSQVCFIDRTLTVREYFF